MSIAVIHDRIMDPANIESAPILLPSGRRRKQNLRVGFRAGGGARGRFCARAWTSSGVFPSAGSGYPRRRNGCPLGRSGRPSRRRGDLSAGALSGVHGSLAGRELAVVCGYLSPRRGCPSGGQV